MWDGATPESQNSCKRVGSGALAEVQEIDNGMAVKGASSRNRAK